MAYRNYNGAQLCRQASAVKFEIADGLQTAMTLCMMPYVRTLFAATCLVNSGTSAAQKTHCAAVCIGCVLTQPHKSGRWESQVAVRNNSLEKRKTLYLTSSSANFTLLSWATPLQLGCSNISTHVQQRALDARPPPYQCSLGPGRSSACLISGAAPAPAQSTSGNLPEESRRCADQTHASSSGKRPVLLRTDDHN